MSISLAHTIEKTQVQTVDGVSLGLYRGQGSGKTCLFQHGLGADHQQCAEAFPHNDEWTMATVECRGHGESAYGPINDISLAQYADDLIYVIETQLEPPIAMGGISMGAALTLRIAAMRPDLISAVVLVRPAWGFEAAPENMKPNLMVGELLTQLSISDACEEFKRSDMYALLKSTSPDNLRSLMSFFDRPDASRFAQILKTISLDGPGVEAHQLNSWLLPTIILATEDDHVHPVALADLLADTLGVHKVLQLTPKHTDKAAYLRDFNDHLHTFLTGLNTQ